MPSEAREVAVCCERMIEFVSHRKARKQWIALLAQYREIAELSDPP